MFANCKEGLQETRIVFNGFKRNTKCIWFLFFLLSNSGGSRDSVDGGLSYGAIFSIIDGTNCCPKVVLACRSVDLVFISFSIQLKKGTVIDFLKQSFGLSASTLSLIICLPHILGFFNLYVQRFTDLNTPLKTLVLELFNICSTVFQ